jgi:hypothetical protein
VVPEPRTASFRIGGHGIYVLAASPPVHSVYPEKVFLGSLTQDLAMTDVLVVYFSRTGYTRRMAEEIARTIGADLEEIRDPTKRSGLLGSGATKVLREMAALCRSVPLATATFDDREIDSGAYSEKMRLFLRALAPPTHATRDAAPRPEPESRLSLQRE